jgi:hypothetical protein
MAAPSAAVNFRDIASASIKATPLATINCAKVDLPLPMPPVKPMRLNAVCDMTASL